MKKNKKQKILFVYPPSPVMNREDRCQQPTAQTKIIPPLAPVDMMSLSAIAKKRGYETKFKDYSLNYETTYDFIRDLREYKPDFLVLNVASTRLEEDLSILSAAKDLLDDTVVIAKGAAFNFNSYSIMQKHPEIDIALRGEIEPAFEEIIQYWDMNEILGITYQIDNKIVATKDRKLPDNLDYLPFLDRELVDNNLYTRPDTNKPQTIIKVAKGCPNNCIFCLAAPLNGKKVRYRSVELVIGEMQECIEKYDIRDFIFWSDLFTASKSWVKKLCNALIDQNMRINFFANTRADTIDEETAELIKKAGCNLVSMGVESGSQEILDKIGKGETLEQIKQAVKILNKAKIQVYTYYVLGLPWETKETIEKTYKFAKELNTQFATFNTATALLGSKFYEFVQKNRLGDINYENPYVYPSVKSYELTSEQIYNYNVKYNREYYLRPRYIFKMLGEIDSFTKLKNYYNALLSFMKKD